MGSKNEYPLREQLERNLCKSQFGKFVQSEGMGETLSSLETKTLKQISWELFEGDFGEFINQLF
jgi:hypothetical protein